VLAKGNIMSSIEIDGFLSEESEKGRKNFLQKYKDVFDFANDINRFSMDCLRKQQIDWENMNKLFIRTLYLRIIENFQGTMLMLERGMMPQAKVLTRAMLETVFILVALQKKPELTQCYLDQYEDGRKRALKAFLQFKGEQLRKSAKEHNLEQHYIEQKKSLKDKELNPLKPKQWAIEAGLEDFYNLFYVSYSNSTHSNLSTLSDHIDNTEKELNVAFGPSENYLIEVFQCCVYILINANHSITLSNGQNIEEQLDIFQNRIKEMDEKYLKNR